MGRIPRDEYKLGERLGGDAMDVSLPGGNISPIDSGETASMELAAVQGERTAKQSSSGEIRVPPELLSYGDEELTIPIRELGPEAMQFLLEVIAYLVNKIVQKEWIIGEQEILDITNLKDGTIVTLILADLTIIPLKVCTIKGEKCLVSARNPNIPFRRIFCKDGILRVGKVLGPKGSGFMPEIAAIRISDKISESRRPSR